MFRTNLLMYHLLRMLTYLCVEFYLGNSGDGRVGPAFGIFTSDF